MLRKYLKDNMPTAAIDAMRTMRDKMAPTPIEDVVLTPYRFEAAPPGTMRLNLVCPTLDPAQAFGGVNTCIDFLLRLMTNLRATQPVELRILLEDNQRLEETVLPAVARTVGLPLDGITVSPGHQGGTVPTRPNDVFMAYNWWTSLNIQPVIEAQAAHFGKPYPKIHFLQEYEPQFFPFSSANLLARAAFDLPWPLWVIINSHELDRYYTRMGHDAARRFIFEPVLNPALGPALDSLPTATKRKRLLVYARPTFNRNCFTIIRRTLMLWAQDPAAQGWEVLSAGMKHKPIPLGRGLVLKPMGRLSLEAYGQMLAETALGLSLMASPHPSYPPLEMAHFGVRVLTNGYTDKDLSRRHDNIISSSDARPEVLAAALAQLCRAFDADPGAGLRATSHMPDFRDGTFACLDAVADSLRDLWR